VHCVGDAILALIIDNYKHHGVVSMGNIILLFLFSQGLLVIF